MALKDEKEYQAAKSKLKDMEAEYTQLRGMEAARDKSSDTHKKLKDMMQPLNDLRGDIDYYEIKNGMRPEGMFVQTREVR